MPSDQMPFASFTRSLAAAALLAVAPLAAGCTPTYTTPAPRHIPRGARGHFRDNLDVTAFQRGNIHTHTTESDGHQDPEEVAEWYRDHGYNFLAITDHNRLTDPSWIRGVERPGFVLIRGEEITMRGGGRDVHVNALCHRRRIGGRKFRSVEDALAWAVRRTREEGGIALVNHPNFHWAFGAEELPAAASARLLEIWSGHPGVHPEGDGARPSVEQMWDEVLSQGIDFAPAAVDDVHFINAERNWKKPGPGRGWIDVFAQRADEAEICNAIARGWLIASNGVRLSRLTVRGDRFAVTAYAPGGTVEFIGSGGRILQRQGVDPFGQRPNVYRLRGGEDYVRARITAPTGARAWTVAYRVAY